MFVRRLINNKTFYEDVYPLKCSYEGLSTIWHFMKMFTPWNVRTKAYQQYDILWRCLPPEMFVRRLINNKTFYEDVYPLKCSYEGLSTIRHFMKMFTPPEMFVRRLKCSYEGLSTIWHFMKMFTPWNVRTKAYQQYDILWRCLPPEMFVRRLINNKTFYEDVYPLKCSYEGLSTIWHFMKMFTPWNVRTKAYQQ